MVVLIDLLEIAVTSESLDTSRTVGAGEYSFQKVFNEGEFLATGVLELPEGSTKPSKNSHSSAMVNHCLISLSNL